MTMRAFRGCVALLTFVCCLGLWLAPAVPMQDYPQHLFVSEVLRARGAAWTQPYEAQLSWEPYSGVYWVLMGLSPWLGVDAAGRVFVTTYFLLFAWVALRLGRDPSRAPWAALWLFPFAINQAYFHGFLNYLITLPLLLLALSQLRDASVRRWQLRDVLCHLLVLQCISWFHPYTLYVYAGLATLELVLPRAAQTSRWVRAAPLLLAGLALVTWQLLFYRDRFRYAYWPFADTVGYLGQLLLGLRANPATALCHALGYGVLVVVLVKTRALRALDSRDLLQVGLVLLAYFALPYQLGSYSCFNWRLAPVVFLLLALALARVALPRAAAWVVASVAVLFACDASYLQLQIGRESGELLPLAAAAPAQAKVAALALDSSSGLLHPKFFYLMHRHEIFYYQLTSKALSPHLWHVPLMPVRYKPGHELREARSLPELIAQDYPLLFVRGPTPELARVLSTTYEPIGESGHWVLLQRNGKDLSR